MNVYRVFPYLPAAAPGEPGHPDYVHRPRQGSGRLDNPTRYRCSYFSAQPSGAVGEVFADLPRWSDAIFTFPALAGARRALGTYHVADDAPILDLDDARHLLDRALRPTQVIARNRPVTQAWALRIFEEQRSGDGDPLWDAVRWWSYHRPLWQVLGFFRNPPLAVKVEPLSLAHTDVVDAARSLHRLIV